MVGRNCSGKLERQVGRGNLERGMWLWATALVGLTAGCTLERRSFPGADAGAQSSASQSATATASDTATDIPSASAPATGTATATAPATSGAPTEEPDGSVPTVMPSDDASAPPSSAPDASTSPDTGAPVPTASATPTEVPDAAVPPSDDVHGKVIDFYGRALSDIDVTIGDATATTDDNGEFTIPDVPETYTLDFRVNRNGVSGNTYVWRYVGLTRRDPTVQSYQTNAPQRSMGMLITTDLPNTSTDNIVAGFGTNQGSQSMTFSYNGRDGSVEWGGPTSLSATGHALVIHVDEDDVPTGYGAYEERDLSFSDGADQTWELLADGATDLSTGNLIGTVTVDKEEYRTNYGFLTFDSHGLLPLFDTQVTTAGFTHLMPSVAGASVLLLADNTGTYDYSGAYAYRYGLGYNQNNVDITIPKPPELISPLSGVTVDASTVFTWDTDNAVSIVRVEDYDYYRGVYIVTEDKALTLDELSAQPLRQGAVHTWQVQTHGNCQSVDECAGADGLLDPMYYYDNGEGGVVKRDGSAAWTTQFGFTAP